MRSPVRWLRSGTAARRHRGVRPGRARRAVAAARARSGFGRSAFAARRAAVEALLDSGLVDRIAVEGPDACRAEARRILGLDPVAAEAA